MSVSWQTVSRDFLPDGSLRDIYVSPATAEDWQQLLGFLRQHGADLNYSVDGKTAPLPASVAEAFAVRPDASPLLTFSFGGIHFTAYFFGEDEIELTVAPNDIRNQTELDILLSFLQRIGDLLAKSVSV